MITSKPRRRLAPAFIWIAVLAYGTLCLLFLRQLLEQHSPRESLPDYRPSAAVTAPPTSLHLEASATLELAPATTTPRLDIANHPLPPLTPEVELTVPSPQIAIIIDDVGYQWRAGERSVALAGNVTLAILPFSPYAQSLARLARTAGKELMLHAPMEPEAHSSWDKGLDTLMDEQAIRTQLASMLASLPSVKGVNNHMGSALTQRGQVMAWVMDELAQRGLYFVDSRTSALSKALEQAQRLDLPSAKRDIFLDNLRTPAAIARQFEKLLDKARSQGSAIAIGHPYPETLAFLENALPNLAMQGVELVPVSTLLKYNAERSKWQYPPKAIGRAPPDGIPL